MRIIDTHCHPQFPQYDADRDAVIARARSAGVGIVCVGTDFEMSRLAVDLARQHPDIWASVGLHPNDNLGERYDQELYAELAADPRVVAIGEVGLDYYRTTEPDKKRAQRDRFERQIDLAVKLSKPLIIHCRSAHDDMVAILENWKLKNDHVRGVIHSFTGTYADAKKYVGLGWYLGLNGIITFARDYDDIVESIPLEHLLLETDAPYLTPEPFRGKRNEPAHVIYAAEQIARLRRIPVEKVAEQTLHNAQKLFNLEIA